ncbi:fad-dependent monooxygenase [Corchorus olitorius]|uniref:Fad-dependent monooxygenase n=1 Tax=Corchorus olitorius TaxID=93759 RepID=A0A1R3JVR9_9ROSI|nr:fad-dependent monooxygenase [Corchorus olitorius]
MEKKGFRQGSKFHRHNHKANLHRGFWQKELAVQFCRRRKLKHQIKANPANREVEISGLVKGKVAEVLAEVILIAEATLIEKDSQPRPVVVIDGFDANREVEQIPAETSGRPQRLRQPNVRLQGYVVGFPSIFLFEAIYPCRNILS